MTNGFTNIVMPVAKNWHSSQHYPENVFSFFKVNKIEKNVCQLVCLSRQSYDEHNQITDAKC